MTESKPYFMYVLLCADKTFYCGFTDDVQRRLATHEAAREQSIPDQRNVIL